MEIGPIPGVRSLPTISPKSTAIELPEVFEIERSSRTDDETYTPSNAKATNGVESDEDEEFEELLEDDPDAQPKAQAPTGSPRRAISYFA